MAAIAVACAVLAPVVRVWPVSMQLRLLLLLGLWVLGIVAFSVVYTLFRAGQFNAARGKELANIHAWGRPLLEISLQVPYSQVARVLALALLVVMLVGGYLSANRYLFPIHERSRRGIDLFLIFDSGFSTAFAALVARGRARAKLQFHEHGAVYYGYHFVPWSELRETLKWNPSSGTVSCSLPRLKSEWASKPPGRWYSEGLITFIVNLRGMNPFAPKGYISEEGRADVDRILRERCTHEIAKSTIDAAVTAR